MLQIQASDLVVAKLFYTSRHSLVFSPGISKEIMTLCVVNKALELKTLYEGFIKGKR